MVGPFNEHMLNESSMATYNKIKSKIKSELQRENIPYYIVKQLPSRLYADASHPLAEGYAMIAKQLLESGLPN